MRMGYAKAGELLAIYKATSTQQDYQRRAREKFPDDDGVVHRAIWFAFDAMNSSTARPAPRVRERFSVNERKAPKRGRG